MHLEIEEELKQIKADRKQVKLRQTVNEAESIKEKDELRKYKEFKDEQIVAQKIQLISPFPAGQQRQPQQKQKPGCIQCLKRKFL